MKQYRVQWAYPRQVGSPTIHNNEASAAGEVAYLLGSWIGRELEHGLEGMRIIEGKNHPEFFDGLAYLLPRIKQFIKEGRVWDAYDLWEDFYLRFENEFEGPLYATFPTVIVEGSPETGLKNRIPFIEPTDVSPRKQYVKERPITVQFSMLHSRMDQVVKELYEDIPRLASLKGVRMITKEQFSQAIKATVKALADKYPYHDEESEKEMLAAFREGILRRVFPKGGGGPSLGALTSWLVQYADIGGAWHPGRHMNETRAKDHAGQYLMELVSRLSHNATTEAMLNRKPEYVKEATALVERIHYLLSDDMIWRAYLEYKEFEREWSPEFGRMPLEMIIGTMRVIPTPEPEPEHCEGGAC